MEIGAWGVIVIIVIVGIWIWSAQDDIDARSRRDELMREQGRDEAERALDDRA